jgi:hypothetical protein
MILKVNEFVHPIAKGRPYEDAQNKKEIMQIEPF